MATAPETSDAQILDLLRCEGPQGVAELAGRVGVTATAVRQRLHRLMAQGLVERDLARDGSGPGRPRHRYSLSELGLQQAGNNYGDLARVLWKEVRAVRDPEVRRGLLQRIVQGLAGSYAGRIRGRNLREKMASLAGLLAERDVPFAVDGSAGLPVLTARACPYPDLAREDRSVCAMEKMLFSEMLGEGLQLTQCRLDGADCCTFETSASR